MDGGDLEVLQMDQGLMGHWAVENEMKLKPGKCKAVRWTIPRVQGPLN